MKYPQILTQIPGPRHICAPDTDVKRVDHLPLTLDHVYAMFIQWYDVCVEVFGDLLNPSW